MSINWMKVEKTTPDKPEVFAIADALGIDPDAAFGKCFRVWRWFDDHCENGNAPSVTRALLDRCASVTGFVNAMISVGWLAEKNGTIRMPNFDRHCSKSAKRRALTAERVQRSRNAPSVTKALPDKSRVDKSKKENTKRKKPAFQKPTLADVTAYCLERGNGIDPQDFIDNYDRVGWVVGKNKTAMRDWQAAIRTWENHRKAQKGQSRLPTDEDLARWNPVDGGLA